MSLYTRRTFLSLAGSAVAVTALAGAVRPSRAAEAIKGLRIGYQKNGVLLVAKEQKLFEQKFGDKGISIKWAEFPSGPPMLEAINSGSIDFGTTGDSPPIFAQAARANLLYVAALPSAGSSAAILVRDDAPLHDLKDLKGKRVGFTKASSAHNLLLAALEKAGLTYADITPVYLAPADAAAAFTRGAIDAWSIWDPYYAIAEQQAGTRVLARGPSITPQNSFFLANRDFTQKHPDIVGALNDEIARATDWTTHHRDEAALLFAAATGVDLKAQQATVQRTDFAITPVTDAIIAQQQAVADRFAALNLIPERINVRDIVWTWTPGA